ncbi:hypothetical protein WJX73_000049 [Symbiochloris irregularis]|uniref:Uncharacterized protein n=1 Tax=Symbiochloris irregularis TaxID=706552 RepID=A0AAW1NXK2_9CHLO
MNASDTVTVESVSDCQRAQDSWHQLHRKSLPIYIKIRSRQITAENMQRFAAALLIVAAFSQVSASLYGPEQCVVFNDIPNELVKCSGAHPVSACSGPSGCTSISNSRDCMSAVCCCSRAPEAMQAKPTKALTVSRRMAQEQPLPLPVPGAPAAGPIPELAPAEGPVPQHLPLAKPLPSEPAAPCLANITYGSVWEEDGGYLNSVNVVLTNLLPKTISIPYTVVISKAGWDDVIQSWNWEAQIEKLNFVSGNFTYGSWQDLQGKGLSSSYFGAIIKSTEPEFTPQDLTLNGVNCKITT